MGFVNGILVIGVQSILIPHLMQDLDVDWLIDAKIPAFAGMTK